VQNINQQQRIVSALAGTALLLAGLTRGRWSGLLLGGTGAALIYRGATGHCELYHALGINTAKHSAQTAIAAQQGVRVEKSLTVNRSPEELFAFWRSPENLPRMMRHLVSVEPIDDTRSRWTASGPLGTQVSWEAEIFNEREPELIAWRSLPDSQVETAGSIHFASLGHGRGTAVVVSMKYNPPAGAVGDTIASLLGSGLQQELSEDLQRFKSMMEAGEVATTKGQTS
jgi:uncharacterized membrane protein